MLSAATTSDQKNPSTGRDPARDAKDAPVQSSRRDQSAEFMHDLAESGTANELSTVKAASDAAEGAEDKDGADEECDERRRTDRGNPSREADG